jgi:hypothetical protein
MEKSEKRKQFECAFKALEPVLLFATAVIMLTILMVTDALSNTRQEEFHGWLNDFQYCPTELRQTDQKRYFIQHYSTPKNIKFQYVTFPNSRPTQ